MDNREVKIVVKGIKGDQGDIGLQGIPGIDGTNGVDGLNGLDGKDGIPGKDGSNGQDGSTGRDGVDGLDGKDGLPGKDGTEVTTETILEKIGSSIPYSAIRNAPDIFSIVRASVASKTYSLNELQDVTVGNVTNGQALVYNTALGKWANATIAAGGGTWGSITGTLSSQTDLQNALNLKATDSLVVHNAGAESITGSKTFAVNQTFDGSFALFTSALSTSIAINNQGIFGYQGDPFMSTLGFSFDGFGGGTFASGLVTINGSTGALVAASLAKTGGTSSQFLKANGTVDSTAYTPTSRTLTINGTTFDLTADRSWTVSGGPSVPISLANAGWGITNTQTNISTNGTINNQAVASVWLNFNGSSNPTDLNGLVAQATGTIVTITNNTSSGLPYVIHHQNSGSTAANRFDLPKSLDITLPFKASVSFRYNGTRWNYAGGFLTNFPVGSNGQLQFANTAGTAIDTTSGLGWDYSNSRLQIPAFAVSGDAQFVGNPRFLQQTTDGTVFFAGSSGSDHGYLQSDGAFVWNNTLKMFTPGNPTAPAGRIHSLGNYLTVGDPTSFTATLVLEVLTAITPTDTESLIYQPIAPTYYGLIDPTSGLPTDATQSLGVGGFTCNGQTITGTVYSGRTIGGQSLVDPIGYATTFTDYVNDGTTAFNLNWFWQPQANSDGSTPDFQIFIDNATGFIYYISSGSNNTFNDSANDPGSVPTYSPFTGFTSSGQLFSFDIGGVATSPTGQPYYSSPSSSSISDTLNNGSLFQIQHSISGAGGDGWKISQGFNQCQNGAGNLTFYQDATFSNGGDLSTQHYGILSDGATLNRDFVATTRNTSPNEYYSTGSLDAPTVDPNDGNYYSITYTFVVPAGAQGVRATEDINGGTYTYRDVLATGSPFYQDALGGHFLGGSPTFTPTYRSLPGVIAENTSDDTFYVPQLKLKTTNANASLGMEWYEQNTLKTSIRHYNSGNLVFLNSNGVYDFTTLNSSGPTINFKNSSGTIIAGVSSTGDLAVSQITIGDAKNILVGSSTGTKIATSTSQKLGFWNATPIIQPTTGITGATFVAGVGTPVTDASTFDGYTLKQAVKALRNAGLLA